MGILGSIGSVFGGGGQPSADLSYGRESVTENGTTKRKKNISQEGIDKLIYDVLSSDQGLSALATAENASGGYGSSSKTLMAQDLIAKVVGEIANITAEEVITNDKKAVSKSAGAKVGTVICTYLATHGYMPLDLYLRGHLAYLKLNPITIRGYHSWGLKVIPYLQGKDKLCKFLGKIAIKRYEYVVDNKFSLIGFASVHIAQPICYMIGLFIPDKQIVAGELNG